MRIAINGDKNITVTYDKWMELLERHIACDDIEVINITDGKNIRNEYAMHYGELHNIPVVKHSPEYEAHKVEGGVSLIRHYISLLSSSDLLVIFDSDEKPTTPSINGFVRERGMRALILFTNYNMPK